MPDELPTVVQSGMLVLSQHANPMRDYQTAIMLPGFIRDFPEHSVILLNSSNFNWFALKASIHGLQLLRFRTDDTSGNVLYMLEKNTPLHIKSAATDI